MASTWGVAEEAQAVSRDIDPELLAGGPGPGRINFADVPAARAALAANAARAGAEPTRQPVSTTDRTVPGPPGAPEVPVRIYRPRERSGRGLLALHGGGYVLGDLDTVHDSALRLADRTGAVVVSADYRLAPEHPYPAALEDCRAVWEWLVGHAAELGADPERLGVYGESAGGGLAAALSLLLRDRGGARPRFQCLLAPQLDDRMDPGPGAVSARAPGLTRADALAGWAAYLSDVGGPGAAEVPCHAAPARADRLAGLPPALVAVCDLDPLRDTGREYAHRLARARVPVELRHYPGTFHAFWTVRTAAVSRALAADRAEAVRRGL